MPKLLAIALAAVLGGAVGAGQLSALPAAAGRPDARVVSIMAGPRQRRVAGKEVLLEIRVDNCGEALLPPVPVALTVDGSHYAEWRLPRALSPGQAETWRLSYSGKRGMHLLVAAVDPLDDVPEASEANNSSFTSIGVEEATGSFPWTALALGALSFAIGLALGLRLRGAGGVPGR